MTNLPVHDVYAVKYAERDAVRAEHFIGGDPHDAPMPMDYFVWAVVGRTARGSSTPASTRRRRRAEAAGCSNGAEALAPWSASMRVVTDVVITHLHYDHAGGFEQFPSARFHVQDREMAFATGRHMTAPALSHALHPRLTSRRW